MGCVASKKTISITPAIDSSGIHCHVSDYSSSRHSSQTTTTNRSAKKESERDRNESSSTEKGIVGVSQRSMRMRNIHRYLEGEQVAAGWPPWLSQVAGEAIQGWVPLKLDSFEKLEKVGQGTYSNVFKARDLNSGKIVALKKVRFDNFEPESVRFMAREIKILRRLNHPNVMKLEGLITSKLSCSLYLVFEYMEHDLAGLSSSPDIKFTEPQVKCYMKQLLSGLDHCHSKGVIHRDIKGANLLINNEGLLKMADFGLANCFDPKKPRPLTSRVVTLWYRPPELLLGSTNYDLSVDLWSVGCVFAEMYQGKPVLQGRTEIEQLHKIFKLCGSPSDEYWKKTKLPHATIFKPHRPYSSSLRETLKSVPENSFNLLETLLAVEPDNRGTASTALDSDYFKTKPFACEPSSLPKYAPNKEMDAKIREDSQRRKASSRGREEGSRKQSRLYRAARDPIKQDSHGKPNGTSGNKSDVKQQMRLFSDLKPFPKMEKIPNPKMEINDSDTDTDAMAFSGPLIVSSSSKFSWANNKQKDGKPNNNNNNNNNRLFHRRSNSKGNISNQESEKEKESDLGEKSSDLGGKSSESSKRGVLMRWSQLGRPDSFDSLDAYGRDEVASKRSTTSGGDQEEEKERMEFSGPLLSQTHKVDEFLERHERHVRQAVRKSWFKKWKRQAK